MYLAIKHVSECTGKVYLLEKQECNTLYAIEFWIKIELLRNYFIYRDYMDENIEWIWNEKILWRFPTKD